MSLRRSFIFHAKGSSLPPVPYLDNYNFFIQGNSFLNIIFYSKHFFIYRFIYNGKIFINFYINNSKIKKYLPNFQFTSLRDGLKETVDFVKNNYSLIRK